MDKLMGYLEALCAAPGVSGDEGAVRDVVCAALDTLGVSYTTDALGSVHAHKNGAQTPTRRLAFAAHMDEVGLIVTGVTDSGYLRFATVGGIDPRVLVGRRLTVGPDRIPAVVGTKPVHLLTQAQRKTVIKATDLVLDIGAKDKEEALRHVRPGDSCVFPDNFLPFGDGFVRSRALDDRVGCAIMLRLLADVLPYDIDCLFSTLEEVGTSGAGPGVFALDPDVAVVLEATTAADIPPVEEDNWVCRLGGGGVITFMDGGTVYDRDLYRLAMDTAAKHDIPCQYKLGVAGANDARVISKSREGVRTIALSVPCRYIHSPACVMQRADFEATYRLARALVDALGER